MRDGSGKLCLEESFFPPLVCKHSNMTGAAPYHGARAHEYIQLGTVAMIRKFMEQSFILRGL